MSDPCLPPGRACRPPVTPDRRSVLAGLGAALCAPVVTAPAQDFAPDHAAVAERARLLASRPFVPVGDVLPAALRDLDYDAFRDIRFRPDRALLGASGGAFRLQLFHPGFLFRTPVVVHVPVDGAWRPVTFAPELFDYGRTPVPAGLPADLGFAGFRLHYPLNRADRLDELAVVLGATYFRVLGAGHRYGLSARLVSLGSGRAGEEFPAVREAWIEDPPAGADRIVVHLLFDGPSLTGAASLAIVPGRETVVDTAVTLVARRDGVRPGIAPLTSMFLTGESDRRIRDDFRSEIHDSDGLLLRTGREGWAWRPLRNPPEPVITPFPAAGLGGFGLLQRDRAFARFEDLEARYDLRPSYWVEPAGDWGQGAVELVELPTPDETNDNIVASWVPARPLAAGESLAVAYRLRAVADPASIHGTGRAVHTFLVRADAPDGTSPRRRFIVDFAGGDLAYWSLDPGRVSVVAEAEDGNVIRRSVQSNPVLRGLRTSVDVQGYAGRPATLRLRLEAGGRVQTETWTYRWEPG